MYIQHMHTSGPAMTTKPSEVRFWSEERLETRQERVSHHDLRLEWGSIEEISRPDLVNTLESVFRWGSRFLLT